MDEIVEMVETGGLAKKKIAYTPLQFDILDALEPHQLDGMGAVGEGGTEARTLARTDCVPIGYLADDLDISVLVRDVGDMVETATVYIFIRILT